MTRFVCPHPVPIAAEVDGDRRIIAIAEPGAGLVRGVGEPSDVTQIRWHKQYWFRLAEGAKMLVRTNDVDSCVQR